MIECDIVFTPTCDECDSVLIGQSDFDSAVKAAVDAGWLVEVETGVEVTMRVLCDECKERD